MGILVFPALRRSDGEAFLAGTPSFDLVIRNLAGVAERTFTWDMRAMRMEGDTGSTPHVMPGTTATDDDMTGMGH